jgi:hypothetical protein
MVVYLSHLDAMCSQVIIGIKCSSLLSLFCPTLFHYMVHRTISDLTFIYSIEDTTSPSSHFLCIFATLFSILHLWSLLALLAIADLFLMNHMIPWLHVRFMTS